MEIDSNCCLIQMVHLHRCTIISGMQCVPSLKKGVSDSILYVSSGPSKEITRRILPSHLPRAANFMMMDMHAPVWVMVTSRFGHASPERLVTYVCALLYG